MKELLILLLLAGCVAPTTGGVVLDGYATALRDMNEHYPDYFTIYYTVDGNQFSAGMCFDGNDWNAYSAKKEALLLAGGERKKVQLTLGPAPMFCGPYWLNLFDNEILSAVVLDGNTP